MSTSKKGSFFTRELLHWNTRFNHREMPWKDEKDPYKIWLSEVILQQTRVEQGREYYNRFVHAYPTVKQLAAAKDDDVYKLWEGLGYYSRCKNLLLTARAIVKNYHAVFPKTYDELLSLKGIGPYTAAAIASFAFQLPYAALDGNVMRILSRYFGISTAIDSTEGKKELAILANLLLDKDDPGTYNQAIMDFGATICKPKQPVCSSCLLAENCTAFTDGEPHAYPVKEKKVKQSSRWLYYFIAGNKDKCYIRKRTEKDIWFQLYEFVLIETNNKKSLAQIQKLEAYKLLMPSTASITKISEVYTHKLTHQTLHIVFIEIRLQAGTRLYGYQLTARSQLKKLAFPKILSLYVEKMGKTIT
jgi:A/G-specific adenine glycosylase